MDKKVFIEPNNSSKREEMIRIAYSKLDDCYTSDWTLDSIFESCKYVVKDDIDRADIQDEPLISEAHEFMEILNMFYTPIDDDTGMKYTIKKKGMDVTYNNVVNVEDTEDTTKLWYVEYSPESDRSILVLETYKWYALDKGCNNFHTEEIVSFRFGDCRCLPFDSFDCGIKAEYDF